MALIVLDSSPLESKAYEQGLEIVLTALDLGLGYTLAGTGDFAAALLGMDGGHEVVRKLRQLELYDGCIYILDADGAISERLGAVFRGMEIGGFRAMLRDSGKAVVL